MTTRSALGECLNPGLASVENDITVCYIMLFLLHLDVIPKSMLATSPFFLIAHPVQMSPTTVKLLDSIAFTVESYILFLIGGDEDLSTYS